MERDKRHIRKLKRVVKRAGRKRRRRQLKRILSERPEDAPFEDVGFGRCSTSNWNGLFHDATRRSNPLSAEGDK